jgi:FkbM family methyltransferase
MPSIYRNTLEHFAQFMLESSVSVSEQSLSGKVLSRLIGRINSRLSKLGDPLVIYELDGYKLLMPISHKLPIYRKKYPDYSSNLGRIAREITLMSPGATAIDIGANIGDSVAIIRHQCFMPILCIEGNEHFLEVLKRNVAVFGGGVQVFGGYVAMETGAIEATASSVDGSAHLRRVTGTGLPPISAKSLQDIIREFPDFRRPRLVKVDTDGFDAAILRGALAMLCENRPVVFFEYDPFFLSANGDSGLSLLNQLRGIGYSKALVYDNFGDYILSVDSDDLPKWRDLDAYFSGRRGDRYMDVCLFADDDVALHDQIRSNEIAYFSSKRPVH